LRGSYRAAIERLGPLAYRLNTKPEKHVIGLPVKQTAPPPAPEPPQRTLPLGPVPVVVGQQRTSCYDTPSEARRGSCNLASFGEVRRDWIPRGFGAHQATARRCFH
jgi:hypothetical protein